MASEERIRREPRKNSMPLYYDEAEDYINELSDEELGKLIKAAILYDMYGVDTAFEDRTLRAFYRIKKNALDRDLSAYREKCEKNRENAQDSWDRRSGIISWEGGYPQFESTEARDAYIKKHGEPPYLR